MEFYIFLCILKSQPVAHTHKKKIERERKRDKKHEAFRKKGHRLRIWELIVKLLLQKNAY